ncbi:MAG: iron-containing alcohol dehydrogenase [SAR92 clade bacterium]|uniref:Iron-containing alcohol dehydrogenase n=1 Tax=SAR92 clade bacterium TaxID=2315479 RepID=A0A520LMT2_9GAMM|nr:MAG: iron-containing alcohol dehydrogenase [SAR92 clade bacterium]
MDNFIFNTVSDIEFGAGFSANLGKIISKMGLRKAFIVTDSGILAHGLMDKALSDLNKLKISYEIFSNVTADPPEEIVLDACNRLILSKCDLVVGFGGGSSMDVAKIIAILAKEKQTLAEMYGVDNIVGTRLPLIQIPTTAGTGSEATMVSIITTGRTTKAGTVSRVLLADKIILDPLLTLGLPSSITAATGVDAMVHAIEAFTSKRLKNPISNMLAVEALKLMSKNIEMAVTDGQNINARSAMLIGAMKAGQAFANAPVAAVHALAYPLGGNYHIPHGLTNSLVLPHVMRFNMDEAYKLYSELAHVVLFDREVPQDEKQASEMLVSYFETLPKRLGLQTTLREMNIPFEDLPRLAEEAMLQQRLLINNPRELNLENALEIYKQAY